MVEIRNSTKGLVLQLREKGELPTYVYVTDLMAKMWNDYMRGIIDNAYARGVLKDLQFTDTQVFGMMERLQVGLRDYNNYDYLEVAYE